MTTTFTARPTEVSVPAVPGRYTIDLDIGSTCTDGFFTSHNEFHVAKVLTTPYNLAECTLACITAGAQKFGIDTSTFLKQAVVTRLSTTLGTNLIVQRAGSRIGLIVTRGEEATLYGDGTAPTVGTFVRPDLIAGIHEEVDADGNVIHGADRQEVLDEVRRMLALGARVIVVSLRHSWRNPANELAVRRYIGERYPAQYLRSSPVQIGTEVTHTADDHLRTNSAIINAYIHAEMARTLYRLEDELRDAGIRKPLLVVQAHGGSGRIAKTVALQTLHSGPAVATRGAARLAEVLGLAKVLTVDMGGTSLDSAVVVDAQCRLRHEPDLEGIPLAAPMVEVESIAAGGSSIARVDNGTLRVGPQSAGSAPGPACFARGGDEATLTDANVVLSFIDPDYFLGGALRLDRKRAEQAIGRRVATPLDVDVTTAASAMRGAMADGAAASLRNLIERHGHAPEGFTMFALGGNSAIHGCLIAERLGVSEIIAFPFCSVFSAFGANTTDIHHRYSRTLEVALDDDGVAVTRAALAALLASGKSDMNGEGFDLRAADVTVEVGQQEGSESTWSTHGTVNLADADQDALVDRIVADLGRTATVHSIGLIVEAKIAHWEPVRLPESAVDVAAISPSGERSVVWDGAGAIDTPVYTDSVFQPGWSADGPLLIETPITNYAVAPGWRATIDAWGNLRMTTGQS